MLMGRWGSGRGGSGLWSERCEFALSQWGVQVLNGSPGMITARTWKIVVEVQRFQRARAMRKTEKKQVRGEARWREWRRMLDEGVYATKAELARGQGVSRAAVTIGLRRLE